MMGRDPAIMRIDRTSGETIYLSYIRQVDNTKWKCKLSGNQIIWGVYTGRWRTHAMDSQVSYKIKGKSIMVRPQHNWVIFVSLTHIFVFKTTGASFLPFKRRFSFKYELVWHKFIF